MSSRSEINDDGGLWILLVGMAFGCVSGSMAGAVLGSGEELVQLHFGLAVVGAVVGGVYGAIGGAILGLFADSCWGSGRSSVVMLRPVSGYGVFRWWC
jgi:hypothetical protein